MLLAVLLAVFHTRFQVAYLSAQLRALKLRCAELEAHIRRQAALIEVRLGMLSGILGERCRARRVCACMCVRAWCSFIGGLMPGAGVEESPPEGAAVCVTLPAAPGLVTLERGAVDGKCCASGRASTLLACHAGADFHVPNHTNQVAHCCARLGHHVACFWPARSRWRWNRRRRKHRGRTTTTFRGGCRHDGCRHRQRKRKRHTHPGRLPSTTWESWRRCRVTRVSHRGDARGRSSDGGARRS